MDVPRGMEYIEKAANQGLAEAQYFVALPVSPVRIRETCRVIFEAKCSQMLERFAHCPHYPP